MPTPAPGSMATDNSRLHELLPDLLSALCEKFDNVECELENCPDLSLSPYELLELKKICGQLCMVAVSECSDFQTAIKEHLPGGISLGIVQGYHILCSAPAISSPCLGLRISLRNSKPPSAASEGSENWRSIVRKSAESFYGRGEGGSTAASIWEFLCVECAENSAAQLFLLNRGQNIGAATKKTQNGTIKAPTNSLSIWLFPFTKIVPSKTLVNGTAATTTTTTLNGTNSAEPAKPKKKVVRRVVKGTKADGTPKKTLVSTKTEKLENGATLVKKTIVDKSSPKENSPDVVQEIVEDPSTVAYVVRLGQSPAKDGLSLETPSLVEKSKAQDASQKSGVESGENMQNGIHTAEIPENPTKKPEQNGDKLPEQNGLLEQTGAKFSNGAKVPEQNGTAKLENGTTKQENRLENGILWTTVDKPIDDPIDTATQAFNNSIQPQPQNDHSNSTPNKIPTGDNKSSNLSSLASAKTPDLPIVDQTRPSTPLQSHSTASKVPRPPCLLSPSQSGTTINRPESPSLSKSCKNQPSASSSSNSSMERIRNLSADRNSSTTTVEPLPTNSKSITQSVEQTNQKPMEIDSKSPISISNSNPSTQNSSITSPNDGSLLSPSLISRPPIPTAALSRRTASPLTLTSESATSAQSASSTFTSSLLNRRLSAGNNPLPMSPTESDVSFMEDLSFASTLTAPFSSTLRPAGEKREISPIAEYPPDMKMRGMADDVPVVALQLVLNTFPYKELSRLRQVHPHWDELCGQLLNSGYYELIHKADLLMTECQRRVNAEKHIQRPLQVLTNLQVHVLNPVDMLRAAMDEGVLCFPYGEILDRSFDLLDRIEEVIGMPEEEGDGVVLNWDRLAKLSRTAQTHYRRYVEPEVEKRMTEVYKLSAQQRLQRLDSFLVETSVNKLEKVTEKARDELRWEVEQLKTQNTQLKRDNRDLKQNCAKLEARVENIERKLKTLGRLLQ